MTDQDHANLVPFNGDSHLAAEFRRLVKQHRIKSIIETGTYKGATTRELSKMVESVYTIESNEKFLRIAAKNLKDCANVKLFHGSSPHILRKILPGIKTPALFFLDAHWERNWPILDELKEIARAGGFSKSVIIIHDFYVPGTDLKYDTYLTTNNFFIVLQSKGFFP